MATLIMHIHTQNIYIYIYIYTYTYICAIFEGIREKGDPKTRCFPPGARRYGARSALVERIGRPGTGCTANGAVENARNQGHARPGRPLTQI